MKNLRLLKMIATLLQFSLIQKFFNFIKYITQCYILRENYEIKRILQNYFLINMKMIFIIKRKNYLRKMVKIFLSNVNIFKRGISMYQSILAQKSGLNQVCNLSFFIAVINPFIPKLGSKLIPFEFNPEWSFASLLVSILMPSASSAKSTSLL